MKNFEKRIKIIEKDKVIGEFTLKENKFDYDIFKKRITRIDIISLSRKNAVGKAIEIAKKHNADFIFTEIDKKNKKTINILKKNGFSEICTNVLFRLYNQKMVKPVKTNIEMRKYREDDINQIKDIARKTYTASHFSLDENFKSKTSLLYEKWAENDCKKGNVFVAVDNGKIIGFVSYDKTKKRGKKIASIGLVRVSKKHQGKGIGNAILNFSLRKLRNFNEIYVGTAEDNPEAIKIYEKNNFKAVKRSISFHKKL